MKCHLILFRIWADQFYHPLWFWVNYCCTFFSYIFEKILGKDFTRASFLQWYIYSQRNYLNYSEYLFSENVRKSIDINKKCHFAVWDTFTTSATIAYVIRELTGVRGTRGKLTSLSEDVLNESHGILLLNFTRLSIRF